MPVLFATSVPSESIFLQRVIYSLSHCDITVVSFWVVFLYIIIITQRGKVNIWEFLYIVLIDFVKNIMV